MAGTQKQEGIAAILRICQLLLMICRRICQDCQTIGKTNRKGTMGMGQGTTKAFEGLKAKISEEVTLTIPNDEGQFRVEVDASDFAMGGILSQHQKDDTWQPVAFISKRMKLRNI